MPRQHPRLLVGRLDEAVAGAAMLGAFAERVDSGDAGLQLIVDHDAAVDRDARVLGQLDIWPDAGREDDGISPMRRPSASSTPSTSRLACIARSRR